MTNPSSSNSDRNTQKLYHKLKTILDNIDQPCDPLDGINDFLITKKSPEDLKKKVSVIFKGYTPEQQKVILDILSPFYKDKTDDQTIKLTPDKKKEIRQKLSEFSSLHKYLAQLDDDQSRSKDAFKSVKLHKNNPYQYIALTQYLKSLESEKPSLNCNPNITDAIADLLMKDINSSNCIGQFSKSELELLVKHFHHLAHNSSLIGLDTDIHERLKLYVSKNLKYILETFSNTKPESLKKLDNETFNKSCLFNKIIHDKLQFLMKGVGMYFDHTKKYKHIYKGFTQSKLKSLTENSVNNVSKENPAQAITIAEVTEITLDKIWEQYNSTHMPSVTLQAYEKLNDELKTQKSKYIELFNSNHNNDFLLSITYAAISTLLTTAMLLNLMPSATVMEMFYIIAPMSFENGLPFYYSNSTEFDVFLYLENLASEIFNFLKFCVTDLFYLIPALIDQHTYPSFMPPIQANDEKNKLRIYRILNYSYVIASLTAIILFPQAQLFAFLFVTNFYSIASYYIHKSVYGTDSTYLDHKAFNTLEASIKNDTTVEPTASLMHQDQPQQKGLKESTKDSKENPSMTLSSIFHINTNGMLAFNEFAPPANAA